MAIKQIPVSASALKVDFSTEVIKESLANLFDYITASLKRTSILLVNIAIRLLNTTIAYLSSLTNLLKRRTRSDFSERTETRRRIRMPSNKFIKPLFITLAVIVFVVVVSKIIGGIGKSRATDKAEIPGALATQEISREFQFPLKDGNDEEVSQIKYFVGDAELRDEIVVQGQRATAVAGRTFLIITLKITNEYDKPIEISTRDYIRLSVNGDEEEWLAPDIHNDPVEVQAISTKLTRVGFPINDSDKNLVLRVGEINGEKEKIALKLK